MITADTFAAVERNINAIFPEANVKNSFLPTGIKLAFTVQTINTDQLDKLASLVMVGCFKINMKRSGTGISIHIH